MADRTPQALTIPSPENRRVAAERFDRGNQVIATGNYDYGIQLLLTCCKLDPSNMLYRQTLRRTQKAKYNNNLRGSRLAFLTTIRTRAKLKNARRTGDYAKVLEHGEEILSRNPWDLGTQHDMAVAAEALGFLDMAIFLLDQARQKYPKNPTINRALARFFEKRGNFSHAIALWQLVKEVVPGDVEAAHKAKDLAASETIQRGQYQESLSGEKPSLKTAPETRKEQPQDRLHRETAPILARLEANPTEPQLYLQLATVYRRGNEMDRCRAVLQKGLNATGNHFLLMIELMELDLQPFRQNLQIIEEKIQAANRLPVDDDDEGSEMESLLRTRKQTLREINNREIELFRLKADRFPQELSHRLDLGIRLFRAELLDQAIVELQQARKDAKIAGKALTYLGYCFKKRNNWRLAQRNFEEALGLIPASDEATRKEILFLLAQGHAEVGEYTRAIDLGHELANLDYGFRDIGKLLDEWEDRLQQA